MWMLEPLSEICPISEDSYLAIHPAYKCSKSEPKDLIKKGAAPKTINSRIGSEDKRPCRVTASRAFARPSVPNRLRNVSRFNLDNHGGNL
jgi:hypothetical protein